MLLPNWVIVTEQYWPGAMHITEPHANDADCIEASEPDPASVLPPDDEEPPPAGFTPSEPGLGCFTAAPFPGAVADPEGLGMTPLGPPCPEM